ncbi:MAG: methionyl-tRNA formyltransferase [Anaerolineae bacterium]
MTRIVFMGTPDFAVPALQALIDASEYEVVGVVTQPDRPAGRGRELRPSPVKAVALAEGIPVFQPATLRTAEAFEQLQAWRPDLIVVAAFGQILRQNVLDLPPYGCINVHASLLPRWRGAAPIQAAIRAGDSETGITIMLMDAGLDTGPILSSAAIPVAPRETGQTLHDKLAKLGGELLLQTLPGYLSGAIKPRPQPDDETLITYAGQIKKEDGRIDWSADAVAIDRLVRAFTPWPGTFTTWEGRTLKIISGEPASGNAGPGKVISHGEGFAVGTGNGLFVPQRVQLAGKKAVSTEEFVRGHRQIIGAQLS